MQLLTYAEIKTKLQNDLDVEDLDFINGDEELLGYINEALDDAESIIHTLGLGNHYFRSQGNITFVSGTADYVLPSDIFANKILKVFYLNGTQKYEVHKVRDLDELPFYQSGDDYKYIPITVAANTTANNNRMRFYPTPQEAGALIEIWYLRNITRMTTSTTDTTNVCEIPEAVNFLFQHCKVRIYEKMGNPNLPLALQMLQKQLTLMTDTLREMTPDENTRMELDLSSYEDQYIPWGKVF